MEIEGTCPMYLLIWKDRKLLQNYPKDGFILYLCPSNQTLAYPFCICPVTLNGLVDVLVAVILSWFQIFQAGFDENHSP